MDFFCVKYGRNWEWHSRLDGFASLACRRKEVWNTKSILSQELYRIFHGVNFRPNESARGEFLARKVSPIDAAAIFIDKLIIDMASIQPYGGFAAQRLRTDLAVQREKEQQKDRAESASDVPPGQCRCNTMYQFIKSKQSKFRILQSIIPKKTYGTYKFCTYIGTYYVRVCHTMDKMCNISGVVCYLLPKNLCVNSIQGLYWFRMFCRCQNGTGNFNFKINARRSDICTLESSQPTNSWPEVWFQKTAN